MRPNDYVKFIVENATELSIPDTMSGLREVDRSPQPAIDRCAVIGGGVMGQGIVIGFLRAGFATTLIETDHKTLTARVADILRTLTHDLRAGRISLEELKNVVGRFDASTNFQTLNNADFVVEAVYENMDLKLDIFRKLDAVCKPDAILCTNTSSLDVEEIAKATRRPSQVVGMHFFVPAQVNELVEIIYERGTTSEKALKTVLYVANRLNKRSVIMHNAPGFVGNRMFRAYLTETLGLLEIGLGPERIDEAFTKFGLAIPPCKCLDLIGLDTVGRITGASGWPGSKIVTELCRNKRFGRKSGKGIYLYKGHQSATDPEFSRLVRNLFPDRRAPPVLTDEEIVKRCLYPLINEGFHVLDERIVERPESIDAVWILGYGWPASNGGPMFWAEQIGLANIVKFLDDSEKSVPDYLWQTSSLLRRIADERLCIFDKKWTSLRSKL